MKNYKIVMFGAGSLVFSARVIADLSKQKSLYGSTIVLHDIHEGRLEQIDAFARRLLKDTGARYTVKSTLNPATALRDADFGI